MRRVIIHMGTAAVLAYVGLCIWLYLAQDKLLYFPTEETEAANAEVITLDNHGVELRIFKVGDGADAVIYFGGNAENVARQVDSFAAAFPGIAVYLPNYRGYGGSGGEPGETGFFSDAALLYDYLQRRHERVVVIGRSLGSGVATWLAAHRPVYRVALVTPYDSVESVAADAYPFAPVSLLLRDKFRSIDYAPYISAPVLVLLAARDRVIPSRNSEALVERFSPAQVTVLKLEGTDHDSISSAPQYFAMLRNFLLPERRGDTEIAAAEKADR